MKPYLSSILYQILTNLNAYCGYPAANHEQYMSQFTHTIHTCVVWLRCVGAGLAHVDEMSPRK